MKYHFKETDYGFNGLVQIFNKKEINMQDWVFKKLNKERGGIEFTTPNAQGTIYLNYSDLYNCDITMVNSKKRFESTLMLDEIEEVIQQIEDMRIREVDRIRNMLKDMFKGSGEEREDGKPF